MNDFFEDVSKEIEIFVNKSIKISNRIEYLLNKRCMTIKDFAKMMNVRKSVVQYWLSGQYNFTLKDILKIESIFNENIIKIR